MLLKTPRSSLTALPLEAFLSFFFFFFPLNSTLYYLQTRADDVRGLIFHTAVPCVGQCVGVWVLRHGSFMQEVARKSHHLAMSFVCMCVLH